jgi:hypothetical protein
MGEIPKIRNETRPDTCEKDGGVPEFTRLSSSFKLGSGKEMEDAMIGFEVIVTLLVTRILLPVGMLLLLGEMIRRSEIKRWTRV